MEGLQRYWCPECQKFTLHVKIDLLGYKCIRCSAPRTQIASTKENIEIDRDGPEYWKGQPPRTFPYPGGTNGRDFTGERFGSLRVVGFLGSQKGKGKWLVQCLCGIYERRRTKSLKHPKEKSTPCQFCKEIESFRHREKMKQEGRYEED